MWHLADAWSRRDAGNVTIVHYRDLLADLEGEMRRLSAPLGLEVPERSWPELVSAAQFDRMRARARLLAPDQQGVLKDTTAFFRRGRSGAGRELLSDAELSRYFARAGELASADLLRWLHRDDQAGDAG